MSDFFTKNIGLKVLALVFSICLWFFVGGLKTKEVGFLVKLDTVGLSRDMSLTMAPPDGVEVKLSGPNGIISKLSPGQVKVTVDLSAATETPAFFALTKSNVEVPLGVRVLSIYPNSFEVRAERFLTKMVKVMVNFKGTPARGFSAVSLTAVPGEVEVVGNKKRLAALKRVYTELIDIEGFDQSRMLPAALDLPGWVERVEPEAVEAQITIQAAQPIAQPSSESSGEPSKVE